MGQNTSSNTSSNTIAAICEWINNIGTTCYSSIASCISGTETIIDEDIKPVLNNVLKDSYPLLEEINEDAKIVVQAIVGAVKAGNMILLNQIIEEALPFLSEGQKQSLVQILLPSLNQKVDNLGNFVIEKLDSNIDYYEEMKANDVNPSVITSIAGAIASTSVCDDAAAQLTGMIEHHA